MLEYIKNNWRKMLPFALVGGIFNFIELGGSYYLIEKEHMTLWIAYTICFVTATIVAYILNTFFTFKSKFDLRNFLIYFSIYMGAMLIGQSFMYFLKLFTEWRDSVYPFLAAPTVYIWNFFMTNKYLKR